MREVLQKILSALNSPLKIGGLEISESALRFVRITDGVPLAVSVPLSPGTIVNGILNDRKKFIDALKALHEKITGGEKKKVFCIVSIPEHTIYSQEIDIPVIAEENMEEAVALNLQMVAPGDSKTLYSDWVRIGEAADGAVKKISILGSFVSREVVDAFTGALQEQQLVVIAVEPPSLALARAMMEGDDVRSGNAGRMLIDVSSDGMHFIIVHNGAPYFSYFVSWKSMQGDERQITTELFMNTITENLRRVLNFWRGKTGSKIQDIVFLAQGLEREIEEAVAHISGAPPMHLSLKKFPTLTDSWFVALGAALRGRIPRGKDIFISLMGVGTEWEFQRTQLTMFIEFWRTIFIATLSAILIFYASANLFVIDTQNNLNAQLAIIGSQPQIVELLILQEEARRFNEGVAFLEAATEDMVAWASIFELIDSIRGGGVEISRLFLQETAKPLVVSGIARNETAAITFKNKIVDNEVFQNVSLPLSKLRQSAEGVSFTINADISELKSKE